MDRFFTMETLSGEPVAAGERMLTPFAQVIQLRLPIWNGRFTWKRPVSILAVEADGQEQVIPVPDITRQVQWALLGGSLVGSLLVALLFRKIRKS